MDFLVSFIECAPEGPLTKKPIPPELLCFNPSTKLLEFITEATCNLNKLANTLDFNCFTFDEFGKECICCHDVNPDSFMQIGIQYAFYMLHNVPGTQQEIVDTRKFIAGRTETVRSCSEECIRFIKAMFTERISSQSKADALRIAAEAHENYVTDALNARGVDRHLLGLKLIAVENQITEPKMFADKAYSQTTNISSKMVVAECDGFMVYSPPEIDGYSCTYNTRRDDINFALTSYKASLITNLDKFQKCLQKALIKMDKILTEAPEAKL